MTDLVALPSNLDAERAVLGAILLHNDAFWRVTAFLDPSDFYERRHAVIYATMRRLLNNNTPVDFISLHDAGLEQNAETSYIVELANAVATSAAIVSHARLIKKAAHQRQVMAVAAKLQETASTRPDDTDALLEASLQSLSSCLTVEGQAEPMKEAVGEALSILQRLSLTPGALVGVPTGFAELDKATGGFQPGQCIVLSACTGMGKSSVALHCLLSAARAGHPVALVSLEMAPSQLALRALSSDSGLSYHRLRNGLVSCGESWKVVKDAGERLGALPFYLIEMASPSMSAILEMGRKLVYQHGIKLLAIDYLGLVQGGIEYKTASENSRLCKIGARQLNIPILALHQLKREVSERPDKHPHLTDLKQTGNIENDADVVLFLYRDSYYTETGLTDDPAELRIAKQRDGPCSTIPILWHSETMSFTEPDGNPL